MRKSRRARRIQRHYGRMHHAGKLNLVSLMDIFTILVFFLMVNSSDVNVLQESSGVNLPESTADRQLTDVLTIEVAGRMVRVNGRPIASLDERSQDGRTLPALARELEQQALSRAGMSKEDGLPVTVMAGKGLSYEELRPVMQTSVEAGFRKVRLAVQHKTEEAPSG